MYEKYIFRSFALKNYIGNIGNLLRLIDHILLHYIFHQNDSCDLVSSTRTFCNFLQSGYNANVFTTIDFTRDFIVFY